MLPRIPEWHVALLGCMKLGAVPMPGTSLLTGRDIAYRVERAEAVAAIVDEEGVAEGRRGARAVRDAPHLDLRRSGRRRRLARLGRGPRARERRRAPDAVPTLAEDPLVLYFTSGTTGYPKMVLHTQASYGIGHEITARFWQDLHPGDLHWTITDMGWAKAAWGKLFGQWRMGAAVFLWDVRGRMDFDRTLRLIGEHGVTTFCAPPTRVPRGRAAWTSRRTTGAGCATSSPRASRSTPR